MLVLSRKVGEKIVVGENITIVVNRVSGNRISLGIDAPADVRIVRGELAREKSAEDASDIPQEVKSRLGAPVVSLPAFEFSTGDVAHRVR